MHEPGSVYPDGSAYPAAAHEKAQSELESDPLGDVLPEAQFRHEERPVEYWYWPSEQEIQELDPAEFEDDGWYLPAAQSRQVPLDRYSPAGHDDGEEDE